MSGYVIYKICCDNIDYVYIGSTKNMIKRKSLHKKSCNNENSKNHNIKLYTTIRDNGGWDNWRMVCIEELGDVSKTQAHIKEEEWRQNLKANLNMIKCYSTEEQKKAQNKEYYIQNRDKLAEYHKEYKMQNKDKLAEYRKEHYEQNKDIKLEYQKEHYEQNREKIAEYKKEHYEQNKDKINEKIICECGCEIIKRTLARHKKTKKHQAWEWRQTIQG